VGEVQGSIVAGQNQRVVHHRERGSVLPDVRAETLGKVYIMLYENTLFGAVDKVAIAIERLRTFEPHDQPYLLAFSGGKDSIVILDLAKRAGVKFDAQYNLTTVDPPELVNFVKTFHEVKIQRPKKTMWQLIDENNFPPIRKIRYCCEELKETYGEGRTVITGVRWAESPRRSKRKMNESCFRNSRKRYLHPIIDWTDGDVWAYIRENGLRYCSLYDEGFKRLGCVMCPLASNKSEYDRWPKIVAAWKRAIYRVWQKRKDRGMRLDFETPEEMWQFWLSGKSKEPDTGQQELPMIYE
jgi:phosphoadenosine phosphosulfate reductase